jgi:membrane fusion protein (multidrug efflux system)
MQAQAISQAELDNSTAALSVAKASVNEQKAIIEKKTIRAPFAGKLGIRSVDVGQYINPGVPIVTLQDLETVYLDFAIPQQDVTRIKTGQKVAIKSDTYVGRTFEGEITSINPKVEMNTRNVYVRASVANADHALLPGMFATAEITIGDASKRVTLPQTAITYNPYGTTVFLVDEKKEEGSEKPKLTARQVFVKLGETRGDQVAILEGVKEGDIVVVAGQVKISNGALLEINNEKLPSNDKNPLPQDK